VWGRAPPPVRRAKLGRVCGTQGRLKLQFEVKGQAYFLNFAEDEARWYVFAPTLTGITRIPVYVDAVKWERFSGTGLRRLSS
jgi:hypothetical protein